MPTGSWDKINTTYHEGFVGPGKRVPLYSDGNHLTIAAQRELARRYLETKQNPLVNKALFGFGTNNCTKNSCIRAKNGTVPNEMVWQNRLVVGE